MESLTSLIGKKVSYSDTWHSGSFFELTVNAIGTDGKFIYLCGSNGNSISIKLDLLFKLIQNKEAIDNNHIDHCNIKSYYKIL